MTCRCIVRDFNVKVQHKTWFESDSFKRGCQNFPRVNAVFPHGKLVWARTAMNSWQACHSPGVFAAVSQDEPKQSHDCQPRKHTMAAMAYIDNGLVAQAKQEIKLRQLFCTGSQETLKH
jgi:hypothetical protein